MAHVVLAGGLNKVFTLFIDGVVCQVHHEVVQVASNGWDIVLGSESG